MQLTCSCYTFEDFCVVTFQTELKKIVVVYFSLQKFSWDFQRREDQVNTAYEK